MTTEALTPEQRTEVRRTLLQSIAEMGRGLTLAKLLLKQGKFHSGRETILGVEAMLAVHEGMGQLLLKENQRLTKQLAAAAALAESWRYKGEHGWGAWQEGHGPDHEGWVLDNASSELRKALED